MNRLSNEEILEILRKRFDADILTADEPAGMLTLTVDKNKAHDIIAYLYTDSLGFQFMTDLCGVHYPEQKGAELGVVYHLHSLQTNKRIRIKTFVPSDKPSLPTVTDIFSTANWMERETYDFFGIIFEGHPNLKRILNMDEMVDFPLRKEFPLEDPLRTDKDDKMFGR
jgi:NADH-quinone oxidoreductase subunit C